MDGLETGSPGPAHANHARKRAKRRVYGSLVGASGGAAGALVARLRRCRPAKSDNSSINDIRASPDVVKARTDSRCFGFKSLWINRAAISIMSFAEARRSLLTRARNSLCAQVK